MVIGKNKIQGLSNQFHISTILLNTFIKFNEVQNKTLNNLLENIFGRINTFMGTNCLKFYFCFYLKTERSALECVFSSDESHVNAYVTMPH